MTLHNSHEMTKSNRPMRSFIVRKPLLTYFVLSYVFFWLFLSLFAITLNTRHLALDSLPSWLMPLATIVGSWMPAAASVIVTAIIAGQDGLKKLLQKFVHFNIAARWYLAAFIPLGLAFVAAVVYQIVEGATATASHHTLSFWLGLILVNFLSGPTGEEAGWRGFALPRLLEKHSPLRAGLILGAVWDFWHLPLWFTSGYTGIGLLLYILFFSVGIISLSVLMTWIFCRTADSLVPMVLAHFSWNFGLVLVGPQGLNLVPTLPLFGIIATLSLTIVIIIWVVGGLHNMPEMNYLQL